MPIVTDARPVPPERDRVRTVAQLTREIRDRLEQVGPVCVVAEVSNVRLPRSGHTYFTLKDADAAIACVLFASVAGRIAERPADGWKIRVWGRISVYPPQGNYQIVVERLEREGKGTLQERCEKLRAKLEAEGLFDERRKKPLPRIPRAVALVTSPTGAVIRDMLNVFDRRFGGLNVLILPVKVQGEGAANDIVRAFRLLDQHRADLESLAGRPIDVVIVGRGGGSLEDLWAFNEEIVARAIAACPIPVVSAVGHETDVTIADYVADRRAATPSVAAELVCPVRGELLETLDRLARRLLLALQRRFAILRTRLDGLASRPVLRFPAERARLLAQRLDELVARLPIALERRVARARERLEALRRRPWILRPWDLVRLRREPVASLGLRLARAGPRIAEPPRQALLRLEDRLRARENELLRRPRERLSHLAALLEGLSPLRVLARGYTLTKRTPDGRVMGSVTEVRPGDHLRVVFRDGAARVWVEGVEPAEG